MQMIVACFSPSPPTFVDVMSTAHKERVTKVLTGWRMTLSRDAATVIFPQQPMRTFPLDPRQIIPFHGHHIHEASEVKAILSSHLHGARRLASYPLSLLACQ